MPNKSKFLNEIEGIADLPVGSLTGEEILVDLEGWDSMQTLNFILMVEENYRFTIDGALITKTIRIDELYSLLQNNCQAQ